MSNSRKILKAILFLITIWLLPKGVNGKEMQYHKTAWQYYVLAMQSMGFYWMSHHWQHSTSAKVLMRVLPYDVQSIMLQKQFWVYDSASKSPQKCANQSEFSNWMWAKLLTESVALQRHGVVLDWRGWKIYKKNYELCLVTGFGRATSATTVTCV